MSGMEKDCTVLTVHYCTNSHYGSLRTVIDNQVSYIEIKQNSVKKYRAPSARLWNIEVNQS